MVVVADPCAARMTTVSGGICAAATGGCAPVVAPERQRRSSRFPYRGGMAERPSGRQESVEARIDRNLGELLQELRVALPGVQVLFAFLLAVPFQQHFSEITPFEKKVYFATLLCTAISAALLISPSAYHRLTFRLQQKEHLIYLANRFAITGLGFLALAMSGAILLITNVLFGTVAATITVTAAISMFAILWYLLPLRRRVRVRSLQASTAAQPAAPPAEPPTR